MQVIKNSELSCANFFHNVNLPEQTKKANKQTIRQREQAKQNLLFDLTRFLSNSKQNLKPSKQYQGLQAANKKQKLIASV